MEFQETSSNLSTPRYTDADENSSNVRFIARISKMIAKEKKQDKTPIRCNKILLKVLDSS